MSEYSVILKETWAKQATWIKVLIIVIFLALSYLLVAYSWDTFRGWVIGNEIESLRKESAEHQNKAKAWEDRADKESADKEQFKGMAAAYKEQTDILTKERNELLQQRPELQKRSIEAGKKVAEIQSRKIQPIDANIRNRVADVSRKLDSLYPDND